MPDSSASQPGPHRPDPSPWMRWVLLAAAAYNLAWGAVVIAAPNLIFDLAGMARPTYPQIWQCVGMIVGVYGLGYAAASLDPLRHWPIVMVGLAGKILGPIGFAAAVIGGEFPLAFGLTIITNDLIWWVPFAIILSRAWTRRASAHPVDPGVPGPSEAMRRAATSHGRTLLEATSERPTLVVFLRHLGCTFCREALADLRARRASLESGGTRLLLVHMSPGDQAEPIFSRHGLDGIEHVSDPDQVLYRAFGLARGSLLQLFGPRVWVRGVLATLRGHLVGKLAGDGLQMPGVFLVENGRIVRAFRHRTAADRPDYAALGACPTPSTEGARCSRPVTGASI